MCGHRCSCLQFDSFLTDHHPHHRQRWIRDKAIQDAKHMYEHLQPLHSSPSSQFIARPPHATSPKAATTGNLTPFPTYEQFTTLRPAPMPSMRTSQASASTMERFRTHGRKISSSLTGRGEKDAAEEMERMVPEWRVEGEVASEAGSEESRDGDSGKGMLGKI